MIDIRTIGLPFTKTVKLYEIGSPMILSYIKRCDECGRRSMVIFFDLNVQNSNLNRCIYCVESDPYLFNGINSVKDMVLLP